jgi:cytochrome bd-type quinol oxidase subunit 2
MDCGLVVFVLVVGLFTTLELLWIVCERAKMDTQTKRKIVITLVLWTAFAYTLQIAVMGLMQISGLWNQPSARWPWYILVAVLLWASLGLVAWCIPVQSKPKTE